jgi:TonB-dependent starch-binding outer membrane protein SusC
MKKNEHSSPPFRVRLTKLLQIMKLSLILTVLTAATISASVFSQANLNMDLSNITVRQAFTEIEQKTGYKFFYLDEQIDGDQIVSVKLNNQSIDDAIKMIFKNENIRYQVFDNKMVVLSVTDLYQKQDLKVTGTIIDALTSEPLAGVYVLIDGTNTGVISDISGKYSIDVRSPNDALVFSFMGYISERFEVSGKSVIDVQLSPDIKALDEVVVIGYGIQKKKLVTGATVQVKGDEILQRSTVSPMTALQSLSPGVNITKISGEPGAGFKVNIRGIGTVGNAMPLYIVDGVPRADINYLTPNDIESIDILKDAASAAIYGARAANGVVLVTTKKGKLNSKMSLSYDGYYGVQNVYKMLPLLNAKEYCIIQNEANVNSGLKPIDWNVMLAPGDYQKIQNGTWNGVNWLKEIENKNAPLQSHAFNISGGNETSVYSAGFSYTSQEGIFGKPVQSNYDRFSFRINSEHSIIRRSFDILKIGENVSFTYTKNHGIGTGNMWWNDISNMIKALPVLPMSATDQNDPAYPYHYSIPWNTNYSNPFADMIYQRGYNTSKSNSLNANVYLVLQPVKGLKYRSSFSVSPNFNSYRSWSPSYELGPVDKSANNKVSQNMGGGYSWMFENTLNYEFSLRGVHNFNVLAGTSAERWGLGENLSTTNVNSVFSDFNHAYIDNANLPANATIGGNPWEEGALLSYFGRVNYDYNEKYMLTALIRADGSSNFAPGKRWGTFPSVSAGWVVSNEDFMASASHFMNFFKLRASWGQNGNASIPGFQYISLITFNNPSTSDFANYYFGSSKTTPHLGAYPGNIPTLNLKWETSEQFDLGLDARFLSSKVSLAFDYYIKKTKDWLVDAPILASWGVTNAPYINGGEIKNKGIELALGYNDKTGELRYSVNANMSLNINEVTRIDNSQGIINATNVKLWGNGTYIARAQVGYPVGYFFGYKTAGLFQNAADVLNYKNSAGTVIMPAAQPGDVKFKDLNDDGVINEDDKVKIGDPNPKVIYSFNVNLDYKGFDLSVTTYGVGGNQIARMWHDAGGPQDNYTTEILGRWHGEGTSNSIPRVLNGSSINQQYFSDMQVENGSYFRISNLTLGYDFKKLINVLPLEQMRLFFTVQNLYTFTKYSGMDPEIGTSTDETAAGWVKGVDLGFYPNPRTVMIGASIKF